MNAIANKKHDAAALIPILPMTATTKNGVRFSPRARSWRFQDETHRLVIDFDHIPSGCKGLEGSLRWCLMTMLRTHATKTVEGYFWEFVNFARALNEAGATCLTIGVHELQIYKSALTREQEDRLGKLRSLLKRWHRLGHPGVRVEAADYLKDLRLRGRPKGLRVLRHDPYVGAFTQREYTLLYQNLEQAYGAGELEAWAYVLARLLFVSGGRISQYASMKLCDLRQRREDEEEPGSYYVDLPQAKKGEVNSRKRLKEMPLSPQTGQLLRDYINRARREGADEFAPLFPSLREDAGEGEFKGHCAGDELSRRFKAAVEVHAPLCERLNGLRLPVAPVRFRYTFGTRLVEERCSRAVVADRLGHADLQHVEVYFSASPQIIENINKGLSELMAPIAQSFRGHLVEDGQGKLANALGAQIHDFTVSTKTLASCASGGCDQVKPAACYTCHRFEPWLDGDHEGVLNRLLSERERQSDPRMSAVSDETINAVREVIAMCAEQRAKRNGKNANG